ncbi:hypothetical protein Q5P01_016656 [Channa striata]|uniref:PRA1 family protein n=1 Tax=Channa striata TaxID=64152 RepID=A0AA88MBU5_CHASR|nr:hypothetical protein Q5P01_016656 [Channa striata]
MAGVQPPPLRSLDDFLLNSARFAVPDVRDLDRWNNRMINNLLYYQSNYFLSALGFLLMVGYFKPFQLFVGAVVVSLSFLGFVWAAENQAPIRRFRRNHPSICFIPCTVDSCPCVGETAQPEEQAGEQTGEHRFKEDTHGTPVGGPGTGTGSWIIERKWKRRNSWTQSVLTAAAATSQAGRTGAQPGGCLPQKEEESNDVTTGLPLLKGPTLQLRPLKETESGTESETHRGTQRGVRLWKKRVECS